MPTLKRIILPTLEEDARINAQIADDPDNPEWTDEDFARAKPAKNVLPKLLGKAATEQLLAQKFKLRAVPSESGMALKTKFHQTVAELSTRAFKAHTAHVKVSLSRGESRKVRSSSADEAVKKIGWADARSSVLHVSEMANKKGVELYTTKSRSARDGSRTGGQSHESYHVIGAFGKTSKLPK